MMPSLRSNKVKQHEEASRHHSKELATLKKEWDDLPTALLFEELEVNPWPVDGLILVLQHDSAVNLPPLPSQRSTPVTSPGRHATPRLPRETPEHTPERVKDEPDERMGSDDEEHGMVQGEERMDCRALGKAVLMDLTEEELAGVEKALSSIKSTMFSLEEEIQKMQPNTRAIEDYKKKAADYKRKKDELDAVTKDRDNVRSQLKQLENDRLTMFLTGFHVIREKLKELYQMITLGGDADLELVDGQDPFSLGISFSVRPPRKSWKQIANLSGGEKTLASLALVFALHHYKPTPLYFMDEIDAALDQRNVAIIANYIKERTQNAQFIIITLRNSMFELADLLVGICKTQDRSKSGEITISGNIGFPEEDMEVDGDEEEDDSDLDEDIEGPIPVAMESGDEDEEEDEEEEEEGKIEEITEEPIAGPKKAAVEEKKPQQKIPAKKTPEKKPEVKEVKKTIEKKEEPKKQEPKKQQQKEEPVVRTKTLAGGLKYEVIRPGHGGTPCPAGKTAKVRYAGRLAKNGKQFDKGSINFRVGMGEVIKGWDMSVKGMQVGEVRKLFVPAHLAYGRGGAPPAIPPNADLVFDMELLNIQGGKKKAGRR
ncbi:structural maintenance of chromosomes smc4, putative [Perkinsus marinus ATCC 50983]|uniref:peptidylprolyl isomerase n=1 Tax=Perkinsus marinus (strain ATCC 50983 / TXsc) TaxID=423536 RepID=C5KEH4_PERM5|nr:structural maintenance of chromosomes smc4, putative [Perkinsus marinus ATCC 50983]EER17112.1 structural maintenance of chromosomes smc4, putative [Perkinsus marinus ATCC 50983]|eukprot:XP_002785316.1 structural maintenance of chromosomes smc4, putative [Perkinsus marinus ATCC 50983]